MPQIKLSFRAKGLIVVRSDRTSPHWAFEWRHCWIFSSCGGKKKSVSYCPNHKKLYLWLVGLIRSCLFLHHKKSSNFLNRTNLRSCVVLGMICLKYIRCYSMQLSVVRLLLLLTLSSPLLCVFLLPLCPKMWAFTALWGLKKREMWNLCL
jgi:hypothetical protein